jgi:hypothetical protein
MLGALVLFAVNGLYQHSAWWRKGGKETVFEDVDAVTSLPSTTSVRSGFGSSFQVGFVALAGMGRLLSRLYQVFLASMQISKHASAGFGA